MTILQIFDKAMCCSTGVCGPQVDPVLPRFAADLDWLKEQGIEVHRYNLAHDPAEFAKSETIKDMIQSEGVDCLPVLVVDGVVVSRNSYPTREKLAEWTGKPIAQRPLLPMAAKPGGCCGSSGCC